MHSSVDIAIATAASFPNAMPDEALLASDLAARGLKAAPVVWSDPSVDWASFRLCVVRTTWDSHLRRDEFVAWAERAGALTALWNPAALLRWNTHKGYLRELAARGVPTVPTVWLSRGERTELAPLLSSRGWADAVVKPAVSAGAQKTIRVTSANLATAQSHLSELLEHQDVMVQPYLGSVEGYGERSLIFIDGEFTHAIRKQPALAPNQQFNSLNADRVEAAEDELALARRILALLGQPTLYARVDMARDADGGLRLMELEITEPSLFLGHCPEASRRLAEAIVRRVSASRP